MSVAKYTKKQFDLIFSDDDLCLDYLFKVQYQNIEQCPNCKRDFKFHKITNKKHYSCQWCSHSLSPALVGCTLRLRTCSLWSQNEVPEDTKSSERHSSPNLAQQ